MQKHEHGTVYLHEVLEAKLLGPGDLTLSIGSAFIENDHAQAPAAAGRRSAEAIKQDCELTAFSRMAPQLTVPDRRCSVRLWPLLPGLPGQALGVRRHLQAQGPADGLG